MPHNPDASPLIRFVSGADPEIGSVGLTELKAKERGFDVAVGVFPFMALGRAKIANETEGFVKIIRDKKYGEILGAHIVGGHASEMIHELAVARQRAALQEVLAQLGIPDPYADRERAN